MSIIIASRKTSCDLAREHPGRYNIVSILEPGIEVPMQVWDYAKECLPLHFHDIEYARDGYVHPTEEHVQKALDFASNKDELVVACHAGISRSSAIAYLIQCTKEHHPRLALKILKPFKHHPNSLIVKIGSELLKERAVLDEYYKWLREGVPAW